MAKDWQQKKLALQGNIRKQATKKISVKVKVHKKISPSKKLVATFIS